MGATMSRRRLADQKAKAVQSKATIQPEVKEEQKKTIIKKKV